MTKDELVEAIGRANDRCDGAGSFLSGQITRRLLCSPAARPVDVRIIGGSGVAMTDRRRFLSVLATAATVAR